MAILVADVDGFAHAVPAIRHKGEWVTVDVPAEDDHILVGDDWYPLDAGSLAAVRSWTELQPTNEPLQASRYLELYRGSGPGFAVIDMLSDQAVEALTGGSTVTRGIDGTMYPYQA